MDNKKMRKILLINLITMGTFSMAHPITPALINELMLPSYMFGVLYSTMAMSNFIMSPIWGSLSDKNGRKFFIIMGILGYGISQIGFGFSKTIHQILLFRVLGGAMSISFITTCVSYVSDVSNKESRTKCLSYHAASTAIGSSIGSLIGGYIGIFGYKMVFIIQLILSLLTVIFVYFVLDETIDKSNEKVKIDLNYFSKSKKLNSTIFSIMIVMTLITIASTSYSSTINYYIESVLNMPTTINGLVMSISGIIALTSNLFINPYLSKKYNEEHTLIVISLIAGTSILIASIFNNILLSFVFLMLFVCTSALVTPIQQSILSKRAKNNYGEVLGLQGSYKAIGMIIGSLASGFIFNIGNRLPFILSGVCCISIVFMVKSLPINKKL